MILIGTCKKQVFTLPVIALCGINIVVHVMERCKASCFD